MFMLMRRVLRCPKQDARNAMRFFACDSTGRRTRFGTVNAHQAAATISREGNGVSSRVLAGLP